MWWQLRELFAEGRAPVTTLNRPIGPDRRLEVVRSRLEPLRQVAHAHDGKVNDAVMAAVAGGLRDLLRSRGEPVENLVLRAVVPMSLHHDVENEPANLDAVMPVRLPIGEPDPFRRLGLIVADTAARKRQPRANPFSFIMGVRFVQQAFLRGYDRQRLVNVYVANVPGPPASMYLAGMPLLEVFPVVPIGGNMTLGVGVLSYAGQLNVTVVADRDGCPDVELFTTGLRGCLDAMAIATATDRARSPVR